MLTCTFAGHRDLVPSGLAASASAAIESLLTTDTAFVFYSGGMGAFDRLCESAVRSAQRAHPALSIQLVLVLPYMKRSLNTQKAAYEQRYDAVLIPEELLGVHPKSAIQRRNRWLVDHSDALIYFVRRDHGGAYAMLRYALPRPALRLIPLA